MPATAPTPREPTDPGLEQVRRVARIATRRGVLRDAARVLGPTMTVGAAAGLVLGLADRLVGPGLGWPWLVGLPMGAALLFGVVRVMMIRRGTVQAAWMVDRALALDERLSSAVGLADRREATPFVELAMRDAEIVAGGLDVRKAVPVQFGGWWSVWPLVAAGAIALGMFMQPMRLLEDRAAIERARLEEAHRSDATAAIDEAIDAVAQAMNDAAPEDIASGDGVEPAAELIAPEERAALEQIRDELAKGDRAPDEARSEAADVLGDAAAAREARAEEARSQDAALRELLESMATGDSGEGGPRASEDFGQALRDGDLARAAKALEELQQQLEAMTPEEREQVGQDLEDLAKQIEEAAAASAAQREDAAAQAVEDLRDRGMAEDVARDVAAEADPERAADALQQEGMEEQSARDLAEQTAAAQRERAAQEQAERDAAQLAEELKASADEARNPKEPGEAPQPEAQPASPEPAQAQPKPSQPSGAASKPREERESGAEDAAQPPEGEPRAGEQRQDQQQQRSGEGEAREQGDAERQGDDAGKQPGASEPRPEQQGPGQTPEGMKGREPAQPDEQGQATDEPGSAPRDGRPAEKPQDAQGGTGSPDQREENEPTGATNDSSTPGQQPGKEPSSGETPGGAQPPSEGRPSEGAQPTPGAVPEGAAPNEEAPQQEGGAPPPAGAPPGGAPGQPKDSGAAPTGGQPSQQPPSGGAPNASSTDANDQGSGAGDGQDSPLESLRKRLQEKSQQGEQASRDARAAEQLRKQQQQLLDQMSPEEREELMRLARNRAIEQGDPEDVRTTPFDARRPGEGLGPQDVAGQVENPSPAPRQAAGTGTGRSVQQELNDRRKEIRRAIEEKRVPARYRNIEEYFRRTAEAAQRPPDGAPAEAPTPGEPVPTEDGGGS